MEHQTIKAVLTDDMQRLGGDNIYNVFDQDILVHINMAVSTFIQLGIGPASGLEVPNIQHGMSYLVHRLTS